MNKIEFENIKKTLNELRPFVLEQKRALKKEKNIARARRGLFPIYYESNLRLLLQKLRHVPFLGVFFVATQKSNFQKIVLH